MSTQTLTPSEAQLLAQSLRCTPLELSRRFEGNALFLDSLNCKAGAELERQNARAALRVPEVGI